MTTKHIYWGLGIAAGLGGGLYYLYNKAVDKAALAASGGTVAFTGGYAMICGSDNSLLDEVNNMNCIQLSTLYNQLKAAHQNAESYYSAIPPQHGRPLIVPKATAQQYMAAMSVVMALMLQKGCAIDSSNSRQYPQDYGHGHAANNGNAATKTF